MEPLPDTGDREPSATLTFFSIGIRTIQRKHERYAGHMIWGIRSMTQGSSEWVVQANFRVVAKLFVWAKEDVVVDVLTRGFEGQSFLCYLVASNSN